MSTKRLWAKLHSQIMRNIITNISKVYNDFFEKLIEVGNNITPLKTVRIKKYK